ncbi:regulatory protein GemA [Pasteurella multocida]|uniref:regulatory protein GemA n=1 Tax=Pasteurella multocida TaxID=747 RepID=UPI0023007774|nr:regulatory protein GemA [Pasteurella multocida]MDA5607036.1 regulatory protein GemA [Pasteurella multocida subsp. multocida]MDA5614701.1 regulatory protein GemA [Pasteurella multocida]MDA5624576.1 regulatory protein GemA [Pasteurella multocida]
MRNKLIQLIHIGKQQLGMDDETYRSLLSQQFYQNSAKNISYSDLIKLVKLLQQLGAKISLPKETTPLTSLQKKLWAVWKSTAEEATNDALNAYVERMGIDKPWNRLNNQETVLILETLKQWQKRIGK